MVGLLAASEAKGAAFGSRFLQQNCCTLYGGRANIDEVSYSPNGDSVLFASRVEADNAGPLLIQSGYIRTFNKSWANCPNVSGQRYRFYEAKTPNGTFCDNFGNTAQVRAAVLWATSGTQSWSAWLTGSRVWLGYVGFGEAKGFLAGGEVGSTGIDAYQEARYGAGDTKWQRAMQRGGGQYYTIQQSYVFRLPSYAWSIGPLPSPFWISGP
jgi:hypothetical protein